MRAFFGLGDLVEWSPIGQPVTRGTAVAVGVGEVLVEYGPWCDRGWMPVEALRLVRAAATA